ncbi:hypothetical protein [Legionella sp.]|uniref:hypothetical protein n=1 Tax=Legionella sp. TaxID=459 RepID=UPI000CBC1201|nr:hypothetical protein [Legionella sp.]PJE16640.1 MAG: hypothetical protein CK430_03140 [Legionella sp.]
MNRKKAIHSLVSQFEEYISHLPDKKLEELESTKFEISFIRVVGKEAGGAKRPEIKKTYGPPRRRL